jgi:hypothetical protein
MLLRTVGLVSTDAVTQTAGYQARLIEPASRHAMRVLLAGFLYGALEKQKARPDLTGRALLNN